MKILVVDDDKTMRMMIAHFLKLAQMDVIFAENGLAAKRILENELITAVITDLSMPGMNGMELIKWIQEEGPSVPAIMISAVGHIEDAVEAMKLGVQDYLVKPFHFDELVIRLKRIIENQHLKDQIELGKRKPSDFKDWLSNSPKMREVKAMVEKVAPTASTVLITGESGTGKEVVARTIHKHSPRADNPFIAINIAGLPDTLLESELFGYEKGAFTGANSRKIGMFELASSGTLFLDEIGDMPMHLQVKLLRVLQERKIQRLGGTLTIPIDVRILAATNKHLDHLIHDGKFREDLYYRLDVIHIDLPPLRERQEDIPLLAGYFIKAANATTGKAIQGFEPEAMKAIQSYEFPGNVRELENMIERAVILAEKEMLTVRNLRLLPMSNGQKTPLKNKAGTLTDLQKETISNALHRWEGNRTKAAAELGINRRTLHNKIKEYNIQA